ncbi:uncharacterized protein LOC135399005 [Ornithodoros turicata]|uniref:uncharacterized protein LOC135399005 n=1 Tax=Ornithodoros turicata TaxID=34597 RepID=UPI003139891E
MLFKLVIGRRSIISFVFGKHVTSYSRSATICVCCAHMDTSKSPPSTAIVKKSVRLLPFSGVPLASDTSITQVPSDKSEEDRPSSPHVATVIDTQAAESSLKSLLGIGSPARTTEPVACKDFVYGPPKSLAFQSCGPDVSMEDHAILDWSLERNVELPLAEGQGNLLKDPEVQSPAANTAPKESIIMEMKQQNPDKSSPRTMLTQPLVQGSGDVATPQDHASGCSAVETSTEVSKRAKKAKARRRRQKRSAAMLPPSTNLRASDSETTDLECKGRTGSCQDTSVKEEGTDGDDCLFAHLPLLVDSAGESESEDGVYSLKPLFTGAYDPASRRGKAKKRQYSDSSDKRRRPNYFVAIQTRNHEIHEKMQNVLDHIRSCEPSISKAFIAIPTLHLTVLVLRVTDDDDSLERAKKALVRSYDLLKDDLNSNPLVLKFKGLGHFKNEVLFAKIEGQEAKDRLRKIADVCLQEFTSSNLDLSGHKEFNPHLTIVKLSKTSKHTCKIRKIQKEWYEKFAEEDFGSQAVFSLQLLSMNKPKDENGYYYCSQECKFENVPVEDVTMTSPPTPTEGSARTSPLAKRKLLELEHAKDNIRRTISSLTKAKLDEITAATLQQEVMDIDEERTHKQERTSDRVTAGATEATFPAETGPEVTCATLPDE